MFPHLRNMYAFYSLLVYIFYTVFKKEEEEAALEGACGESPEVCVAAADTPIDMLIYAFPIVCIKCVQVEKRNDLIFLKKY